jgi:phage baseplate assembly protein W
MATYSDIDLFLVKNSLTNDISFKQDIHAVAQSIKNIVYTRKGEALFNNNFGSTLLGSLSVKRDLLELEVIKDTVKAEIQNQETRATINNIEIIPYIDSYEVRISFSLILTDQQGAVAFTV